MRFIDFVFSRSVLKLCDVLSYIEAPWGYGSELVYPVHFSIFSDFGCVCISRVIVYYTDDFIGYFVVMMVIHMSGNRFVSIVFNVSQIFFVAFYIKKGIIQVASSSATYFIVNLL